MKVLNLYAWEDTDLSREERICDDIFDEINLYFHDEITAWVTPVSVEHINKYNIKLNVLTISTDVDYVKKHLLEVGLRNELISISLFPLYWILKTHAELINFNNLYYRENTKRQNFTYPFLTFNGKSKYHRCYLIDELCNNNFLSEGIFSFHGSAEKINYEWKYYTGDKKEIDGSIVNSYIFDDTFVKSFLHIVAESNDDVIAITEKTMIPLLNELPFLVVGAKGFHEYLKTLGFKLYYELFDYSFDKEEHIHDRIQKLLKNVKFVIENKHRLDELYARIKPDIEFNKKHALKLISSINCVPDMLKEHYHNLKDKKVMSSDEMVIVRNFNYFEDVEKVNIEDVRIKRRTQYYNYWYDNFSYDKVIENIYLDEPEEIIIFGEQEWEIWAKKNFVDLVNKRNIKVKYTTASVVDEKYLERVKELGINNITVEQWSTYYFKFSTEKLNLLKENKPSVFKYPFICLNNRGHEHRCRVIDYITKYNLLDKGIISWVDPLHEAGTFKYFDGNQILLNDDMKNEQSSYIIPNEYYESLFDFVTESTSLAVIISEKTIKPLVFKKPFVIIGDKGINRYLESLGFKLYDEIIDYTFDDVDDLDTRAKLYVENMKKVSELTNLDDIYNQLLPKIEHNYNLCLYFSKSKDDIPKEIEKILPMVLTNPFIEELDCLAIYKQIFGENI
jgi:hypothetical protein